MSFEAVVVVAHAARTELGIAGCSIQKYFCRDSVPLAVHLVLFLHHLRSSDVPVAIDVDRTAAGVVKLAGTLEIAKRNAEEKQALNYSTSRDVLRIAVHQLNCHYFPRQELYWVLHCLQKVVAAVLLVQVHVRAAVQLLQAAVVVDKVVRMAIAHVTHREPSYAVPDTHPGLDTSHQLRPEVHPTDGDAVAQAAVAIAAA